MAADAPALADVGAHTFALGTDVQTDRAMARSLEADA